MNRGERRRAIKFAEKSLAARGIDPEAMDEFVLVALARRLQALFATAKISGNIDGAVKYLASQSGATLRGLRNVAVACGKGCSHCCHTRVSVTAPEVLHIAKIVRPRGPAAIAKVEAAHNATKDHPLEIRHPYPCPLLEDDVCSIYDHRPTVCRFAASGDADICARSYRNLGEEDVPMPVTYMMGRGAYAIAWAAALKHVDLSYRSYEFSGALLRALQRKDAERAWLSGEDVFAGLLTDAEDPFDGPEANRLYQAAFL